MGKEKWELQHDKTQKWLVLGIISLSSTHLKRIGPQSQHWPIDNCGPQAKTTKLPDRPIL
jgi:hypothetical protein